MKFMALMLCLMTWGRAPHGARGLKWTLGNGPGGQRRRAPHGARGLKLNQVSPTLNDYESRPARGARIEIAEELLLQLPDKGRAPHGARGLK